MKLTYPNVYNFSIDGEKLFMQFLLASFSFLFIYILTRSMRIFEEHYKKTTKNIVKLKARLNITLAQNGPVYEKVLHHNVMRCKRSLIASYLKDLIDNKQCDQQKYSTFVNGLNQSLSNKQTFNHPSGTIIGRSDLTLKLNTENLPGKESSTANSIFDEVNILREKPTTQESVQKQKNKLEESRINEFTTVSSTPESKIFKTLEGQMRKKTARSNLFEKKRTKTTTWNMMQGLKNVHDVSNENLKLCSALSSAKSPFKNSSLKKPSLLKNPYTYNEIKIYTAITNTKSPFKVSSFKKPQLNKMGLGLDTGKAKLLSKRPNSNIQSFISEVRNLQQNKNMVNEDQESSFENMNCAQELVIKNPEDHSACISGFKSDCESESCIEPRVQVPISSANNKQISILTTINEESAEENSSIDSV